MTKTELRSNIRGIFVLHVTPFSKAGGIDHEALRANIQRTLDEGAHGVVVGGTYAEYPSMSGDERVELFRTAVAATEERVPVVCCTAASSTAEAIDLTRRAKDVGADAAMITPPYVHEVRPQDIERHFAAIGDGVDLPVMIYRSTSIGVGIEPELMGRLAELPNIVAVKQGATDLHEQVRSLAAVDGNAAMLCGSDGVALASICLGYAGCSSTLSNFMTSEYVALFHEIQAGELAAARERFFRWQVLRNLMREVGQPAGVKAAMEILGYAAGSPRLPFGEVGDSVRHRIQDALERAGIASGGPARVRA